MPATRPASARRLPPACLALALTLTLAIPPARAAEPPPAAQPLPKADLNSPLGKQLQEKLDAIDHEIARLRNAGGKSASYADQLARQVAPVRDYRVS